LDSDLCLRECSNLELLQEVQEVLAS
jgi:hypothetical protein